ncbi:MAG TPA: hypothetical protein VMA75_05020 [Candidatus Paceibacterota bacterium]|nr:hypothetical protein [Candidatus Paceibacterota bacterium]
MAINERGEFVRERPAPEREDVYNESQEEKESVQDQLKRKGVHVGMVRPFNISDSYADVLNGEEIKITEIDPATGNVTFEFTNPDLTYLNEEFNPRNVGNLFRWTAGIGKLFNDEKQEYKKSELKPREKKINEGASTVKASAYERTSGLAIRKEINFGATSYVISIPEAGEIRISDPKYIPDTTASKIEQAPLGENITIFTFALRAILSQARGVFAEDPEKFKEWLKKENILWNESGSNLEKGYFKLG